MSTLHVALGGQNFTFEAPRVVTIGRDPGSDIVLRGPSVSRRHGELRSDGSGWVFVDVGSSSGTWQGPVRVSEVRLSGRTALRFGSTDGEELVLTPAAAAPRPAVPVPGGFPPPGLAQTVLPGAGPVGGGPAPGPGLLVRTPTGPRRFPPGSVVRIGRDPAGEVVVDDPSVSRLHGVIEGRPNGWWYVDRSTAGTYVDEDKIVTRKVEEPTTFMLGHPTAGVELEVVPVVAAGAAQKSLARTKRRRTATSFVVALGLIVAAAGLAVGLVAFNGGDDDKGTGPTVGEGLTDAELDRAKLASVLVVAVDPSGQPLYTGSGTIISSDGLILTNAHVGKPSAPGQYPPAQDPGGLLIALTSEKDDSPAAASYSAEAIVADGVLDLAVLKITGDAQGDPIEDGDLDLPQPIELADSDELRTGDEITALGFPAVAHVASDDGLDRALTVTRGVVSTFLKEAAVESSRAWIDSDIRIGSGNSGGASIDEDGRLVGINTAVVTEATVGQSGEGGAFTGGSARIRPANLAAKIIDIAKDGGDPDYVSPYYEEMPDPPADPMGTASAGGAGWSVDGVSDCATPSTLQNPQRLSGVSLPGTVFAHFRVIGLSDGTEFTVEVYSPEDELIGSLEGRWTLGDDEVCAVVGIDLPAGLTGANAVLVVGESQVPNPVVFE
ncbi:trypsin-like peptidase domain-containing protein [Nocardioides sp. zg-ZUI104]|uniref:FHA domain-containing protein n=1 Tax=Nocardioides faecalis TaxID=2803858 RepID=UPI001BD0D316|nr:FHA domain-containing protein [Nocardioides faecalis]MBS4753156.1 trypsin-like peptidase domain-containing protein [Nocardioides faecalis]